MLLCSRFACDGNKNKIMKYRIKIETNSDLSIFYYPQVKKSFFGKWMALNYKDAHKLEEPITESLTMSQGHILKFNAELAIKLHKNQKKNERIIDYEYVR